MQNLPPDFFPRVNQALLPYLDGEDEREAWLTQAYYLRDPRLYHQIDRSGASIVFLTRCVKTLLTFGCFTDKQHALSQLLLTIRHYCGVNQQTEIDALVEMTNALCQPDELPAPRDRSAPTPPPTPRQDITTPAGDRSPTVFVSYSHRDDTITEQIVSDLNADGHAIWVDVTGIKGGDEWMRSICEGINLSYAFVVLCSTRSLASRWVRDEILWARQRDKQIIPVLLEDVTADDNFFGLHTYQGIKLYEDYDTGIRDLLEVLPNPTIAADETITVSTRSTRLVSQRERELEYLDRLRFEELLNTEKYTALGGQSQVTPDETPTRERRVQSIVARQEFRHTRVSNEHERETRTFENAVEEILDIRRAVVLGEPGAGKTTTLWKLARELVDTALDDPAAPIPLVVRLAKWTQADQSLPDFIASQLGGLGQHVPTLLETQRAVILLDGLNEIPVAQRKAKDPQVQTFIEQLPDLMAVVTCRERDYTLDLGFDTIEITPLDPIRIREFVTRYLGDEDGETIFWKLAGEQAKVLEADFMESLADKLNEPKRVFWNQRQLPDDAEWGYSYQSKWQNWLSERDHPSSLMVLAKNPYMLFMLTDVYDETGDLPDNRGELFQRFVDTLLVREKIASRDKVTGQVTTTDEADTLVAVLTDLAFEMQIQRSQEDDGNAVTALPLSEVRRFLTTERLEYLAASTSILSLSDEVRFTHQLLQEYFAARALQQRIFESDTPLQATSIWGADSWWQPTNWEEAVILLAGLYSDDCTPVLDWVAKANPEVAAQCITRSGAHTPDETLLRFRERWLPRLTDIENDPQPAARAAAGRALGQVRLSDDTLLDNRRGVALRPDGIPDIDWVEVPVGTFLYGDNDKDAYGFFEPADERQMHLPTFYIARYPVTYRQFQAFVDAEDGFFNDQWWEGLAKQETDVGNQAFKFWNHPRERVSWYDAVAFCRWLSHKLGYQVRLPTEFEWEKAARGIEGLNFAYGQDFDASKGNNSETGLSQTSAVGIFPHGASPYGAIDMTGNVWEWCATAYDNPAENYADEDLSSSVARVLRGSSWGSSNLNARAAVRHSNGINDRYLNDGFRVCRSPSPS